MILLTIDGLQHIKETTLLHNTWKQRKQHNCTFTKQHNYTFSPFGH